MTSGHGFQQRKASRDLSIQVLLSSSQCSISKERQHAAKVWRLGGLKIDLHTAQVFAPESPDQRHLRLKPSRET